MRGIVYGKDSQIGYSAYHTNFSISTLPFSPGKRTRKNSSFAAHPWVPLVPLSPGIWAAKKPAGLTGRDPLHTQPTIVVNKHPASKPWKHRFPYHLKDVQVWTKSVKKKRTSGYREYREDIVQPTSRKVRKQKPKGSREDVR
jgi:hypothetical protein